MGVIQERVSITHVKPSSFNQRPTLSDKKMSWIIADVKSFFTSPPSSLQQTPKVGSQAPTDTALTFLLSTPKPAIVTFLRHLGCPFCEKSTRIVLDLAREGSGEQVEWYLISHATKEQDDEWFSTVLANHKPEPLSSCPPNVHLVADPERTLYSKWGVGFLSSFWQIISWDGIQKLQKLGKEDGIYNTYTHGSGGRWQNHATFGVDEGGKVGWVHVGKDAADVSDYASARDSVLGK